MHSLNISTPCFINTSLASLQLATHVTLAQRSRPSLRDSSSSRRLPGSSASTAMMNFLTASRRSSLRKSNLVSNDLALGEGAPSGTEMAFLNPATSRDSASISPSVMMVTSSLMSSYLYRIFSAPATCLKFFPPSLYLTLITSPFRV